MIYEKVTQAYIDQINQVAREAGFGLQEFTSGRNPLLFRSCYTLVDKNNQRAINCKGEALLLLVSWGDAELINKEAKQLGRPGNLRRFWSVQTEVINTDDECYEDYNPTLLPGGRRYNHTFIYEATPESLSLILKETAKRFYNP